MKTIGVIGGITWLSSLDYYRIINETINQRLGSSHGGKIILYSVDFAEIKLLNEQHDWDGISKVLCDAAKKLEQAGADCVLIGANTMHKVAGEVRSAVNIPLIHVAEETARQIRKQNIERVLLLGTRYTMELDFYSNTLSQAGIKTIIPEKADREFIHDSIYNELGKGILLAETKQKYIQIINRMVSQGAQGVILGCTEIPLLITSNDCSVPVFNTTMIHATAAVEFALKKEMQLSER